MKIRKLINTQILYFLMIHMKTKNVALIITIILMISIAIPLLTYKAAAQEDEAPYGSWVDEVDYFVAKEPAKVVSMLEKGDMHLFFREIGDPDIFQKVKASPNLKYKIAYGGSYELTFNPVGPEFTTGELNPFSNKRIREAMNYIVDRDYIVDEIMGGLAVPKWFSLTSALPEYGRLADVIKPLEAKYKYNFTKGKEIIFEEMKKMGATFKDGKWYYKGKEVVIKFIIRVEDQRRQIGDYVANQLEKLGFKVERMYKTMREAGAIWYASDPAAGKWHIYTGGWAATGLSRDDSWVFGFFSTKLGLSSPLWQAYKPDPEFFGIAKKLWNNEWKTWEERTELMRKGIEYEIKESFRVWLVDQVTPYVSRKEIDVACDLAAGFNNPIWARTIRFVGKVGGVVKAGSVDVLTDPWNPVAGTNSLYDAIILSAVNDFDTLSNPYTGLPMPNRFVNATVYVEKGIYTKASSDWVKLVFVDKIKVPEDAWYAWNVSAKKLETVPSGTYTKAKVVVNYGDPIGHVKYHDGSVMSLADWVALWPLGFERVYNGSPLFDESAIEGHKNWRRLWRGMRIISVHPLIIEYYVNYTHQEAEFIAEWAAGWPNIPWHVRTVGIYAEENGMGVAFSSYKADKIGAEWTNYIGGPSLKILNEALNKMISEGYIPFKEWAGKYITREEAIARYNNLKKWYEKHGHFWVASGPFYLDSVNFQAHQAVIKAFRDYTYKADRWSWLSEPPKPESSLSVPDVIIQGFKATFTVNLKYKGKPYPNDRIDFVKYIILDTTGNVVYYGNAEAKEPGTWEISLDSTKTSSLKPGVYKIMTIALSKDVAIPATNTGAFTVLPLITKSYVEGLVSQAQSQLNAKITALENTVTETQSKVASLQGSISSMQGLIYASMGLALLSIIIAIYAITLGKRKKE